ncbi:MAG: hypothetical protein IJA78_05005 [Clostridia bacterium]|nr:hypothetical protein [Clostridia bacterium]
MKKRTLALLLALLLCLCVIFTACKDDPPPETPDEGGKKGQIHETTDAGGDVDPKDSNPVFGDDTMRY